MILLLIYILPLLLFGWFYLKWLKVKRYWADRGVPHEPPNVLLGSLTFLLKINPAMWMRDIYHRFPNKPYVGIWLFWRPALVVNSPELARRILVKDFDAFRNRLLGTGTGEVDPIGGQNIFTVNDPLWSSIRRRLTPVFTSSKLKSFHKLYSTKAKELVQRIDNSLKNNNSLELRSLYADYTTDVIGTAAFGIQCDATMTGDSILRTVTRDFMKFSVMRGFAWSCIFFLPEAAKLFGFKFFPKDSEDTFKRVYKKIVAERGGYTNESQQNDLLDALRKIKYEADNNNEDMDEDLLIAQAAIFLQGGFDTSASTLTFLTYEMAYKPEMQEKVYQELLEAKQQLGDNDFDASVYSNLVYLNCVIKEALRKYPPMGWLDRVADRDYRIDDNLTIPKGMPVYVNGVGMQLDPNFYPEPDKFDPDRFLPENDDGSRPYMPFGEGPRTCIEKVFFELLPDNTTINSEVYCHQLDKLNDSLKEKRPELINRKGVVFHQDNARPHTSLVTRQNLLQLEWDVLQHPLYSPDLVPSDYYLSRSLQNFLDGKNFTSNEDVKNHLNQFFASKDQNFYERGIMLLPERWQKVLDQNSQYII